MAKGILIAAMDFSAAPEDEFHDWYDLEHVPERLRVPGFLNADRWIGIENPKISVATYDLDNVGVLRSPAYLAVGGDNGSPWTKRTAKFRKGILRYEGEQLFPGDRVAPREAAALLMVAMNVVRRARARIQRMVQHRAHPGPGLGARHPMRAPLPRRGRDPALCGALSSDRPRGGAFGRLEESRRHAVDAKVAPAFPRPSALRLPPLHARRLRRGVAAPGPADF